MDKKPVRIQKYISMCGVASRRKAEELIALGRVKVNGNRAITGMSVVPGRDKVEIDGKALRSQKEKIYLAINKPRGYVTTLNDELGRRCITALTTEIKERVYPVGRLDKDSEGLLLLTNDGAFANMLMHPSHHVPKVYHVSVRPAITEEQLVKIEAGMELSDGEKTSPARALVLRQEPDRSTVEITLYEGKNREIRRICETLGLEVARLSRVGVGNIKLGGLRPGEYRVLEKKELLSLQKIAREKKM